MPLLDSFTVDHTRMEAPAVRVAKTMIKLNVTSLRMLSTVTVAQLNALEPASVSGHTAGKLIQGDTWYYVTTVAAGEAKDVSVGDTVHVSFSRDFYNQIDMVQQNPMISRTDLTQRVGLTPASVINITNSLMESGILVQAGLTDGSAQGRRALLLNVNPKVAYVLGLHMDTEAVTVSVGDYSGNFVSTVKTPISSYEGCQSILDKMFAATEQSLRESGVDAGKVLGMPAFIVTLATLNLMYGLAGIICEGFPIANVFPDWFLQIGIGKVGIVPVPAIILFVVFILAHILMTYTTTGRSIYAVGGNAEAARLSGINVFKTKIIVFSSVQIMEFCIART